MECDLLSVLSYHRFFSSVCIIVSFSIVLYIVILFLCVHHFGLVVSTVLAK